MAARCHAQHPRRLPSEESAVPLIALTLQTCGASTGIVFETSGSTKLVNLVLLRNWVLEVSGVSVITAPGVAFAAICSTKLLKSFRAAAVTSNSTLWCSGTFCLPTKTLGGFTSFACTAMFELCILDETLERRVLENPKPIIL